MKTITKDHICKILFCFWVFLIFLFFWKGEVRGEEGWKLVRFSESFRQEIVYTMFVIESPRAEIVNLYFETFRTNMNINVKESIEKEIGKKISRKIEFEVGRKQLKGKEAEKFAEKILRYDLSSMREDQFLRGQFGEIFPIDLNYTSLIYSEDKRSNKIERAIGNNVVVFDLVQEELPEDLRDFESLSREISSAYSEISKMEIGIQEVKIFNEIGKVKEYLEEKNLVNSLRFIERIELEVQEIRNDLLKGLKE